VLGPSVIDSVKLTGIRVTGFPGDGLFAFGTSHLVAAHDEFDHNGGYGIFTNTSDGMTMRDDSSHDNGDAGFYIGDSPDAHAVVERNRSYRNAAEGVLLRDSTDALISNNVLWGNCVGLFVLETGQPAPSGLAVVTHNRVRDNNRFCPAEVGGHPALSGIGIGLLGTHDSVVLDNEVSGHRHDDRAALPSGGLVLLDTTALGGAAPTGNRIVRNHLDGNQLDLLSDGSGSNNTIRHNRCATSVPDGLCASS